MLHYMFSHQILDKSWGGIFVDLTDQEIKERCQIKVVVSNGAGTSQDIVSQLSSSQEDLEQVKVRILYTITFYICVTLFYSEMMT